MISLKQLFLVLILACFIGCTGTTPVGQVDVVKGKDGKDGKDGKNGYSLVSQFLTLSTGSLECANGGTSLDIYMDLDYSLAVSDGDVYTGSLIACNGLNGLQGIQGLAGTNGANGSDGKDGTNGIDGINGSDGSSCTAISAIGGVNLICGTNAPVFISDGANGSNGNDGANGNDGTDGIDGINGADGSSCSATSVIGGVDITCGANAPVFIANGTDGTNGTNGAQGVAGVVGPQGIAGPQGATGPQGVAGPQGAVGPQGLPGAQGAQGPAGAGATITAFTSATCIPITGTVYYVKTNSIYSGSTCSTGSRLTQLNTGNTYWVGTTKLAVADGTIGIKVISYN